MIVADAAFVIGKMHRICEDYALAQSDADGFASVWLSDGCSSSQNTDIGARLLTHILQQRWRDFDAVANAPSDHVTPLLNALLRENIAIAATITARLGLPSDCLDATLLALVPLSASDAENDSVGAIWCGDGAVVWGLRNGTRIVYRARYSAGYPFYPVYLTDVTRHARWKTVDNNARTVCRTVIAADGTVGTTETFGSGSECHLLRHSRRDLRFAAIVSDGVESYTERCDAAPTSLDYLRVVAELTAFKNFTGSFVQRRIQAFEKACAKRGWQHHDDISVAALYWTAEE